MNEDIGKAVGQGPAEHAPGPQTQVTAPEPDDEEQSEDSEDSDSKSESRLGLDAVIIITVVFAVIFGAGYAIGHYILHWSNLRSLIAAPLITAAVCLLIAIAGWLDLFD
jgi:hypothetical protein